MTKQQAIKALAQAGATNIQQVGKFSVRFDYKGQDVLGDPRDLLAEIMTLSQLRELANETAAKFPDPSHNK